MSEDIVSLMDYFLELDKLKQVERRSYIQTGHRVENSAEHSWHLAMACWIIANKFSLDLSQEKLIKLALIHDLGEIDAGDTFLYAPNRLSAHEEERRGVHRLASHQGNFIADLVDLWEEQELGISKEARLLKVVDRILPFLLNLVSQGRTWMEARIKKSQVLDAHKFIEQEFPEIGAWIKENIELAVKKGWLENS